MARIKKIIIRSLEKASGVKNPNLEFSARSDFGDYTTNIALQSKNPKKTAEAILDKLNKNKNLEDVIDRIEIAGPGFINFHLSTKVLTNNLIQILEEKEKYGRSTEGKGKKWLIEHTSPNPNKAMHLGHLRNNVTGMAIANLWEAVGIKVIRDDIDNNRGISIAKLMWGYLKFANKKKRGNLDISYWYKHQNEWMEPEDLNLRPDKFVDELYTRASVDFENPEVESQVRQMVVDWEKGDKENRELWKKVLAYSYLGQKMTLKRLGNKWDKIWHEHEHYKLGKKIVEEGLKKGVFKIGKGGAIVTDLKKYKLPDTVVIKSDGTALYITQDLALTKLKIDTFRPDHLYWVIGPEQSLALKQLFAVCDQLGIGRLDQFTHIVFGYMSRKGQGKMSSRKGNVIYIDDLLDQAKAEIERRIEGQFTPQEKDKISEEVGVAAVKYSILKVGRLQDIAFDFDESLSFDGNSGPYLQYTYARTQSVVHKSQFLNLSFGNDIDNFDDEELLVLRELVKFSNIIQMAGENYAPNILCGYLFDLAGKYNTFYNKLKIIGSENEKFRLALTLATGQVLKNGLTLLGISALEKM